jgi:diguanylate cyclase (GGDEF)-like protein
VQARTDSLTGLPNRRHFDEVLEREWRRALRAGSWLGLLMIDVDHFKSYNDQFGHHVGDQTLAAIAGCIADTAQRATDFAARYGGEEFAVLLSGKEAQDAIRLAERICAAVAAMERSPGVPSGLTVSVGVACLMPDAHAIQQDLVGTADRGTVRRQAKRTQPRRVGRAAGGLRAAAAGGLAHDPEWKRKGPALRPARLAAFNRCSGQEVSLDAEHDAQDILIVDTGDRGRPCTVRAQGNAGALVGRVEMGPQHVQADVEIWVRVPLRPRTDLPPTEIRRAGIAIGWRRHRDPDGRLNDA